MPTNDRVHRLVIHMTGTSMIYMLLILVIILKMRLIPQSTLAVLTIHASYTHVATEDQHVHYRPMNTSDVDYDNPTEHVTQENTCFKFEA